MFFLKMGVFYHPALLLILLNATVPSQQVTNQHSIMFRQQKGRVIVLYEYSNTDERTFFNLQPLAN